MVISRRQILSGSVATAALALARVPLSALGFAEEPDEGQLVPFLDAQPMDPKRPMVKWEGLTDWITPQAEFFAVSHYGSREVASDGWKLRIEGLAQKPLGLSLDDLKARPRREATVTLECSGTGAGPGFLGAIGNARWVGTPLFALLRDCAPTPRATEVIFWGADSGKAKVHNDI